MNTQRLLLPLCLLLTLLPPLVAQGGPPGATVNDLSVSPGNPDDMFAATSQGVYVSSTAGEIWTAHNEGLPQRETPRVAGTAALLYVAVRGEGVYRSADGGAWGSVTNQLAGFDVISVEADPSDAGIVYAGTAGNGVYKSLNRGDAWTSVSAGLPEGNYFEIRISPLDPELVFASSLSTTASVGRLHRSTNGGTSWEEVISGPAVFTGLGFSISEAGVIWVASSGGLFFSDDSGGSFAGPQIPNVDFQDVAVDPDDSQVVYAATRGSGLLQTANGGAGWDFTGPGLPRGITQRLAVTSDRVYVGFSGSGIYRSMDGGGRWVFSSAGLHAADILALSGNPSEPDDVLVSTTGGGMFRTMSGGEVWSESRDGLFSRQVVALDRDSQNPDVVFAGTINPQVNGDGAFLRSTDGGGGWQTAAAGLSVFAVATHPSEAGVVYLGTPTSQFTADPGLLVSFDAGETVEVVYGDSGELLSLDVLHIEFDPVNPRNMYLIVRNPFLFPAVYQVARSRDDTRSWSGSAASTVAYTGLVVDPTSPSRLYLASLNGLYRSTNSGESFELAVNGLPDGGAVSVSSIAVDARASGVVYAATSAGVFRSAPGAGSWSPVDNGLNGARVRKLLVDPANAGVIYAATFSAGVYKTTDGGATWKPTGGVAAASSRGVVNAFTFHNGAVSPGEVTSIYGQSMGPVEGVSAGLDPDTGKLPTELAGVRVFFNDIAAPLFFVRADQVNVQVPYEVAGLETVEVRIEYQGSVTGAVTVKVAATHPGLWGGAINQDSSLNSEQNPAAANSVVVLYATGQGVVAPAVMTGQPAPGVAPFPKPEAAIRVLINGQEAEVLFAGLTPEFVGLLQVNLRLPAGLTGKLEAELFAGPAASPVKAPIFVQ